MSTTKPRITITLEPQVYEVLRRLSAASGDSMSAIVTNFLDVAVPPMERMVVIMEQAKAIPDEAKESLRGAILRAEAQVLPAAAAVIDQADLFLADALSIAREAVPRGAATHRAERSPEALTTPVPVTRGSGRPIRRKSISEKGGR
jgi:hypothetical protein